MTKKCLGHIRHSRNICWKKEWISIVDLLSCVDRGMQRYIIFSIIEKDWKQPKYPLMGICLNKPLKTKVYFWTNA